MALKSESAYHEQLTRQRDVTTERQQHSKPREWQISTELLNRCSTLNSLLSGHIINLSLLYHIVEL